MVAKIILPDPTQRLPGPLHRLHHPGARTVTSTDLATATDDDLSFMLEAVYRHGTDAELHAVQAEIVRRQPKPGSPMTAADEVSGHILRLRGEDFDEAKGYGGWIIDGIDGYDPEIDGCWDTAQDAMDAHPGKWWSDEDGGWLCHAEDLAP